MDTLRPLLEDAHQRALIQNHKALLIGLRGAERALRTGKGQRQARADLYRGFAYALQRLRQVGPFSLQPGQRVALLAKGDHTSLTVRNADGSLDARMRQRLLAVIEGLATEIPEEWPESMHEAAPGEWAALVLLRSVPLEEVVDKEKDEVWDEIIDSPAGQILGSYIPGLSVLLKLFRHRQRLQEGEWMTVAGDILGDGARSAAQGTLQLLLSQLRSGAKLAGPLSFLFGISVDRAILLKRQLAEVEAAEKRLQRLHSYYKGRFF